MRSEIRDIGIIWVAVIISNLFNYLYHIYMARTLTPSEYGELFSLLSLFAVISVVFMAIETTVAKFVVEYKMTNETTKIRGMVYPGSLKMVFLGAAVLLIGAPFFVVVAGFLKVSPMLVFVLFLSLPLGMAASVYQGVMRGLQRFKSLSVMLGVPPVFKLIFGGLLVGVGLGVFGGILSVLLSMAAAFVMGLYLLQEFLRKERVQKVRMNEMFSYGILTITILMLYNLLVNLDVLLAKHYLPPEIAGEYSALSLMGRMVLFVSGAVNIVVFPKFVESRENSTLKAGTLYKAMAISTVLSGSLITVYIAMPDFLISILYGGQYSQIKPYLIPYSIGMLFIAVIGVIVNYNLARESKKSIVALLGVIFFEIFAISTYHLMIHQIVLSFLISTTIGLIIMIISTKM